ncbi:MAG: class I SAM-dependent methyltransferase [Acidimicrobiales bacterium]
MSESNQSTSHTPAGDFDYEAHGSGYGLRRRTDPRIASLVHAALADARTVLNVGAGTGSYEPTDRYVVSVEPSESMRSQRSRDRPAMNGRAESLPFDDDSFDAAMAMVTIHQWWDGDAGLRELRRVSRGPVVILTFDGDALDRFWLGDYAPELIAAEKTRYPSMEHISRVLGGETSVQAVPIAIDCVDGFTEAFYARPEAFLEAEVRGSQSAWGFVDSEAEQRSISRLREDLDSGAWDRQYGSLRRLPEFVGSLRLVVSVPS